MQNDANPTRHLADLLARGCLVKRPGGGRSTCYQIQWPADGNTTRTQSPPHEQQRNRPETLKHQ